MNACINGCAASNAELGCNSLSGVVVKFATPIASMFAAHLVERKRGLLLSCFEGLLICVQGLLLLDQVGFSVGIQVARIGRSIQVNLYFDLPITTQTSLLPASNGCAKILMLEHLLLT